MQLQQIGIRSRTCSNDAVITHANQIIYVSNNLGDLGNELIINYSVCIMNSDR